jgi:Undecaprenyl-phosphate galactose phosphotransferase WbaP
MSSVDNVLLTKRAKSAVWDGISQRIVLLMLRFARVWMTALLLLTDMTSLLLAAMIAVAARAFLAHFTGFWSSIDLLYSGSFQPGVYLRLAPLIFVFLAVYAWRGLVPAIGISPVEELRRLSITTSIVALALASIAYLTKSPTYYSRIVFGLFWILALALVPLGREIVRGVASRAGLWGEPVAIIGYGTRGRWVADYLLRHLTLGLRPVVALNGTHEGGGKAPSIPLIQVGTPHRLEQVTRFARVNTAILVVPEVSEELLDDLVEPRKRVFERLITISEKGQLGSLWVRPLDLGGLLALEVKQNLLSVWQRMLKRTLDLVVISVGTVVFLPLCFMIALLIWLESRGSVLYGHERVGRDGQKIKVWKFRTMVPDADQVLQRNLDENPELRAEWEVSFKLKDDPRVTRIGKFLRKSSFDEFPQVWNVIRGEMSLVGPRPIVEREASRYDNGYRMYTSVRPGITGLWQISGRNDVGYGVRVMLDEYYVRNWSLWLDIYVLASTPWVVLSRRGAY